ncbi:hypothetical protein LS68_003615 [Helicobacter sp. MIT 05-5293]|uniref:PDDEXK-like family protein n=1 Tax=Helicobacter sp. MIT 05-5293 TaxID=1548149 RepID=UPI00051DC5B0|nr:PD-(D/E)XK nuclease family protein [Helicobacter sp. MIT 05-5293]TLD82095.1 hypothetical protein LS68_003615 [Helicobacter sp. MIT 05-5293]
MEEVKEEKYNVFFKKAKDFKQKAEIHKRRGNNDFNPYLEMRSARNEVKLHSALLCGFLNPHNNHYQGDVFLESFLEAIDKCSESKASKDEGLKEWFGNTSHADVYSEYNHIDIYITNGQRHIIVENKIWAGDQEKQIQRYIETIAQDDNGENVSYEDIAVLYLAPQPNKNNKRMPSQDSLGEWKIQGDYLERDGDKVRFHAVSYNKEILKWIDLAKQKVGCITNLNTALAFYKDVVQIITNTKENTTMSLAKFLTKDTNNMKYQLEIVWDIFGMKEEICKEYSKAIMKKYSDEIEAKGFEIIEGVEDVDSRGVVWLYPYVIKPKDCGEYYFVFCIEYTKKNENNGYGVRLTGNYPNSSKSPEENKKIREKIEEYLGISFKHQWWYRPSRDSNSMQGAESALEAFLNDSKIKEFNDKLKNYKAK